METRYYEYGFYYDNVLIENIVPFKSKMMHLTLCFPLSMSNIWTMKLMNSNDW